MKIRWRGCDVSQTGYAQNFGLRRRQRMEYSMPLEEIAADIDALVTGDTSQGFEQPISIQLVARQCGCISFQPTIEPAVWRYECSFKTDEGIGDVSGVRAAAVGGSEFPPHVGIRGEFFDDFRHAGAHELRVFQRSFGVRLEGANVSLPTEAKIERGVEYRGSVKRKAGAIEANVLALCACTICAEIVARRATARIVVRQAGIAE